MIRDPFEFKSIAEYTRRPQRMMKNYTEGFQPGEKKKIGNLEVFICFECHLNLYVWLRNH